MILLNRWGVSFLEAIMRNQLAIDLQRFSVSDDLMNLDFSLK